MKTSKILISISAVVIAGLSFAAANVAEAKGGAHFSGASAASRSMSSVKLAKLPIGPVGTIKPKPPIGPIKTPPIKLPPIVQPPVKPPVKPPHDTHYKNRYLGGSVVVAAVGSCGWMKVRALETGSRYWWARYEACVAE